MQAGFIVTAGALLPPLFALYGLSEGTVLRVASAIMAPPIAWFVASGTGPGRGAAGRRGARFISVVLRTPAVAGAPAGAGAPARRPGVLVVHEWWGLDEHARSQARRLAEAGYVGFALDMYGKGKVTTHPQEAQGFVAEATKDPAVVAARFNAALEQLKQDPHVDPKRVAVIGYCFGGAVALDMARSGADLAAVATVQRPLATKTPAAPGTIKARS